MTRDEMKAKLKTVIEDTIDRLHHRDVLPSVIANAAAAAVLDLCGPKPLEWEEPCRQNNYCTIARTKCGDYYVDVCGGRHQAWMESLTKPYEVQIGEPLGCMYAAQAAAQAHADAAHWANTKVGDL
jgi:hypothetical protein